MTTTERIALDISEVEKRLQSSLGGRVISSEVKIHAEGRAGKKNESLWMRIERDALHNAVREVIDIDFPHLGVISAVDAGDDIELIYHLYIFFGLSGSEKAVYLTVPVPKNDLVIPTISDLIPGAVYTEREKQEMIGITVEGISDRRRLFLPPDFPDDVYPWRKDEFGIPDSMIKNLWKSERPTSRPNPPVKPKEKKKTDSGGESKKSDKSGKKTDSQITEDENTALRPTDENSGEKNDSTEMPEVKKR
jgi:membrane-bound hydrogenase subunit beta